MIYITGDTHRTFSRLLVPGIELSTDNTLIILGDAGINFYLNQEDVFIKQWLNDLGITILSLQGNHEERPENISTYHEVERINGKVYVEDQFPNLVFAKNGEVYNIEGNRILVIGGAYSVDKYYRLRKGLPWFKDEQLSKKEKEEILDKVNGLEVDYVFTHTCPYKYIPTEAFLPGIDQSLVDNSMEHFLDQVDDVIDYKKWYCGHYHIEKDLGNIEFMYYRVKELKKDKVYKKVDHNI
jgi:3-oxoacid CoA-transferase subunit A